MIPPTVRARPVAARRSTIPRASFAEAQAQILLDPPTLKGRDRLERIILQHLPASPSEAVCMLDVVIPDLEAGGRSDGLDVKALCSIRAWLDGSAD
ncbi:MAG: hypothetical protein J0I28_01910 [Caulobacterales bacterium]|nr:hypothetical protein [Caulobacterales bacterium]